MKTLQGVLCSVVIVSVAMNSATKKKKKDRKHRQHVAPHALINALHSGSAASVSSRDANEPVRLTPAVSDNWAQFIGFPMQYLLLVGLAFNVVNYSKTCS